MLRERHAERRLATPMLREQYFRGLSYGTFECELLALNMHIRSPEDTREGFIPDDHDNVQTVTDKQGASVIPMRILQNSISSLSNRILLTEALRRGQRMQHADAALVLLGLVVMTNHRMHNGHTRTLAAGRQLLSPIGRGYTGASEDDSFYAELITSRPQYMTQSLHVSTAGLPERYTRACLDDLVDEGGPRLTGTTGEGRAEVLQMLPEWAQDDVCFGIADFIDECDFGLATLIEHIRRSGRSIERYIVQDDGPKFSIERFLSGERGRLPAVNREMRIAHDNQKSRFVRSIIRCIAGGDERIYGPGEAVLAHYALPQD